MRVTNLIKNYVIKAVDEKIPDPPKPESIERVKAEWEQLRKELDAMVVERVKRFFINHKGECAPRYCDRDLNDIDAIFACVEKTCGASLHLTLTCADTVAYVKACTEIDKKRAETVNNILVTLELGGNKADLDAMLANL